MTREEVRKCVDAKAMEDLIVKQTNLSCDIFEKGFENGFYFGCKFAIDKTCEWLQHNVYRFYWENCTQQEHGVYIDKLLDQLKKAMEQ